jgi:uncharacterized protein YcfJ
MLSKVVTGLVSAGLLLTGQAALATDHGHGKHHYRGNPYERVDYDDDDGPQYDGGPQYDYARVVDVDPIVRHVRVSYPKRECWNETRYEEVQSGGPRPVAGSMILGGIIGAALGNQVGRGDGRRAATVAGAVIGSAIGHDVGERRNARYASPVYTESRPYDVQRCEVRNEESFEDRVDGYRVTYEYCGRRQTMVLPYDPGDRVRVRVDVQPVG